MGVCGAGGYRDRLLVGAGRGEEPGELRRLRQRWDGKQPAPVGSFAPNPYGLYDTAGNVWEWVEDCHHESYRGAPADGRAWVDDKTCGLRVLRGGSWFYDPGHLRSAYRLRLYPHNRFDFVGFRLSRTL